MTCVWLPTPATCQLRPRSSAATAAARPTRRELFSTVTGAVAVGTLGLAGFVDCGLTGPTCAFGVPAVDGAAVAVSTGCVGCEVGVVAAVWLGAGPTAAGDCPEPDEPPL